jgi:hypothetical protein
MKITQIFLTLSLLLAAVVPASASGWNPGDTPGGGLNPSPGDAPTKVDHSAFQLPVPSSLTAQVDRYGYTYDDSLAPAWKDLTASGTEVDFFTRDDDAAGPISMGFDFKFYENVYSELYVSTNGMVTFGEASDLYVNSPMPRDTNPNNFVTPFWDDLILLVDNSSQKISKVYYQTGTDAAGKFIAIEWYRVARLGSQDFLTFEVILYENGSILFQYHDLAGVLDQATVGIEDEHGVDGLLYLHNAPGLSISKAIKFIRPGVPDWRVKVYPDYRSSFTVKRQARLDFAVRNTGNKAEADVFDMSFSSVSPGWSLTLFSGDGKTPLKDTDGDGVVDTGSLAPGADLPVAIKVSAPDTALAGDYIAPLLTATSSRNPGKSASIKMQIALPAPFAQASLDLMVGPNVRLIWKENLYGTNLNQGQQFTGSNLSLVALPDKNYIYTWEHNTGMMANLEYTILNRFGVVLKPVTKLTDNSQASYDTADRFLSLASTLNGRIGAIWVRTLSRDADQKINQNIYFTILDNAGNVVVDPVNLTQNNLWRGRDDYDVPMYLSPRIVVTEDGKFVLAWGDERNHAAGSSADMFYAVYDQDGNQIFPITGLTASIAGEVRYTTPALVALPGNRAVLIYIVMDPGDPDDPQDDISTAAYVAVNSAGGLVKNQTLIAGSTGSTPDGILTSGGKVVFGWNLTGSAQVQYVLMDSQTLDVTSGPHSLATPKGREASVVSVTMDESGHAILSWGDAEQSDYLSYALVDENGGTATPPMVFTTGLGNEPLINTNSYGLGNAPYDGSWQVQLPSIQR